MNITIQEGALPLCNRPDSPQIGTKVAEKIPPFQLYENTGPKILDTGTSKHLDINEAIYDKCLKKMHVWFFPQILSSGWQKQLIPAFGGFISAKGTVPARKTTIDNFTPIN